jgi:polysaccharide deacetylase 2 family uncharacterized protein YibQ
MRTTILSLTVIGLALAAIVAGYFSGQAGTRPPEIAGPRPLPTHAVVALLKGASDSAVNDEFSDDDVVVDRPAVATNWLSPQLSIVIALAGNAAVVDAQFIGIGVPLAFDLDPHGADALRTAQYVHQAGDLLFMHVTSPPTATQLAALRKRFGPIDGIAALDPSGMPDALVRTGLTYFDERGDADVRPFEAASVRVIARDATVDDRTAGTYIAFMLQRSAQRSQRQGRLVVLMRPLASSLDALQAFVRTRSAQIVPLTQDS